MSQVSSDRVASLDALADFLLEPTPVRWGRQSLDILAMTTPLAPAFLAGTFGGITPFVLRIALGLSNQDPNAKAAVRDPWLIVGIIFLGLLGGGLAAVWKEPDVRKAFQLGLGLPSLLTVFNTGASAPKITFDHLFRADMVHAASKPVAGRKLRIGVPAEVSSSSMSAVFDDSPKGRLVVPFTAGTEIDVPKEASSVEVRSDLFEAEPVTLPASPNVLLDLTFAKADKKPFYGFLYSIGVQSHAYKLRSPKMIVTPRS